MATCIYVGAVRVVRWWTFAVIWVVAIAVSRCCHTPVVTGYTSDASTFIYIYTPIYRCVYANMGDHTNFSTHTTSKMWLALTESTKKSRARYWF